MRQGAQGWCRGMGWGGRWEGCSGWGTHVYPWLIHVNVWQKPPQYCKVIRPQLKKKSLCMKPFLSKSPFFFLTKMKYLGSIVDS